MRGEERMGLISWLRGESRQPERTHYELDLYGMPIMPDPPSTFDDARMRLDGAQAMKDAAWKRYRDTIR
jgi:hypothetical protein